VDILERSVNKIVHRITLDDDSIKLSNFITNPAQYGKFHTTVNNTLKVIEKALSDKKATANSSTNEELARNVLDPSSPQNPHGGQPVSEIQQLMNMMTEQNRVANLSWINIANDIAQNKALLTANKTETDNTLKIMQKTMQDLTVRINTIEAGTGNSVQHPTMNDPVSPTIPQVIYISDPKTAKFAKKLQEYLKHTNEDIQSVIKSQWIVDKAISNEIDFTRNAKLSVINRNNNAENQRVGKESRNNNRNIEQGKEKDRRGGKKERNRRKRKKERRSNKERKNRQERKT